MTLSAIDIVLIVVISFMLGVSCMYAFFVNVIVPNVGKTLQKTNMPKSYARDAINHYWVYINRVAEHFPLSAQRTLLQNTNDQLAKLLIQFVEEPTSFIPVPGVNQNGQDTRENKSSIEEKSV